VPGEYRRRQTDGRFARKDRAGTFRTILDDKFVLYTAGSCTTPNGRETLTQSLNRKGVTSKNFYQTGND